LKSKKFEEQLLALKERESALEQERNRFALEKEKWKTETRKELEARLKFDFEKYSTIHAHYALILFTIIVMFFAI